MVGQRPPLQKRENDKEAKKINSVINRAPRSSYRWKENNDPSVDEWMIRVMASLHGIHHWRQEKTHHSGIKFRRGCPRFAQEERRIKVVETEC